MLLSQRSTSRRANALRYCLSLDASGVGALSPICLTFASSSDICIPESASKSAGTCAAIFVMSPVILCTPAASPSPVETMVILSTLLQRRRERAHDLGQAGDQLVDDGGLVVLLERLGLDVHGPGFGVAFLEDDVRFGVASARAWPPPGLRLRR